MKPTIGRIVHYRLTELDAEAINRRRADAAASTIIEDKTGAVVHVGNHANAGDYYPAIVVRTWPASDRVNLQVMLDGTDTLWVTSVCEGDEPGAWMWPPRIEGPAAA